MYADYVLPKNNRCTIQSLDAYEFTQKLNNEIVYSIIQSQHWPPPMKMTMNVAITSMWCHVVIIVTTIRLLQPHNDPGIVVTTHHHVTSIVATSNNYDSCLQLIGLFISWAYKNSTRVGWFVLQVWERIA